MNKAGKSAGLFGFEQIKNVYLETKTLQELDLVTVTQKTMRHQAKEHFKPIFEILYKEGEIDSKGGN